jgi:hypothetical protein
MLRGLFGPSSVIYALRAGLDESMRTHDKIAERVAGSATSNSSGDFANALKGATAKRDEADLQRDMAELADTQLRYEAESTMLHAAYAGLRTAVRERL